MMEPEGCRLWSGQRPQLDWRMLQITGLMRPVADLLIHQQSDEQICMFCVFSSANKPHLVVKRPFVCVFVISPVKPRCCFVLCGFICII